MRYQVSLNEHQIIAACCEWLARRGKVVDINTPWSVEFDQSKRKPGRLAYITTVEDAPPNPDVRYDPKPQ